MAKNKIEIDVKVDDKGTTKKVGLEAKKAGQGLDKLSKSAGEADRNIKGAAQASSNSTKNFSKMSQGMGGLVAAYATLAANVFAISAAFNFLKSAGDLRVLEEGQLAYAQKTGTSLALLTTEVQAATGALLNFEEAAQAVAIGTAAGLGSQQIIGLADVAKRASMALGRDLTDSFNRLTRGAIKAEPELLDELGIIIRLDTVTKEYARTLNKSAKDLTTFQKSQAVVNAVIDQGITKFDDLGGSVNQLAKLGKSFNDVINSIKEGLVPLAEFIATSLSNNIMALAGAFAFLGTGIAKSLAGAPPMLEDISGAADSAKASLQAAAGTSVIGQKLAEDPSSLSEAELKRVEQSASAKSSTIIKYDNISRQAVITNIKVIKAERQLMEAQGKVGLKRFYATWKAELALLQATHGRVLGTMKAAMQGFARATSAVLGVAGIIGLLFTAIGLVRELIASFKSDEFKRFVENNKAFNDILKAQVKEVGNLSDTLKEAKTESEALNQTANLISNISFKNLEGFSLEKLSFETQGNFISGEPIEKLEAQRETVQNILDTLNVQIKNFEARGLDASPLKAKAEQLAEGLALIPKAIGSISAADLQQRAMLPEINEGIDLITQGMTGLEEANAKLVKPTVDANNALKGLAATGEEFNKLQDKMKEPTSQFREFLKIVKDAKTALSEGGIELIAELTPEQQNTIRRLLGGEVFDNLKTTTEAINLLKEKSTDIIESEQKLMLDKIKLDIKYEKALRYATVGQAKRLNLSKQEAKISQEITELQEKDRLQSLALLERSETQILVDNERLNLLKEQLLTIQAQQNEMQQLSASFKGGFESGLQTNIAELIKGEESSIKDAMLKIAESALTSVADKLSEIFTGKIMDFIFPTEDPALKMKNALVEGGTIAAEKIKAAVSGQSISAGSKDLPVLEEIDMSTIPKKIPTEGEDKVIVSKSLDAHVKASSLLYDKGEGTKGLGTLFEGFTDKLKGIFSSENPLLQGFSSLFGGLGNMFSSLLSSLGGLFGGGSGGGISSLLGMVTGFFGFANGGYAAGGFRAFANGGMVDRPTLGLIGEGKYNEAIVPLPNGRSIPVDMKGAGQQNNVVVNVSVDSQGRGQTTTESQSGADAGNLGKAIAQAVQQELQNQKRSGGILNPYGVA